MIVRYGEKIMCNATNDEGQEVPISVIEYVINDLKEDELSFHNPLHRQILTEAAAHIHDEGFTAERYFLAHPEPSELSFFHEAHGEKHIPAEFPRDRHWFH